MKTALLASFTTLACSALALAAPAEESTQFQGYPKNLARQHLGSNLLQFNTTTRMYTPTQAAAAWLDDDVTTGWPLMAEKQYYLLSLSRPELVTNFALSTRPSSGTVSVYASDTAAAPGAETWSPLIKDAPLDTVNQKLSRPFSRVAKYLLIETQVPDPGPVYSVYLYGNKPAASFDVQKRDRAIDPRSVFGPFVNEGTSFNVAGLYAKSHVTQSSGNADVVGLQKAIDDNPETSITVEPSGNTPTVIRYDKSRTISRVALLSDAGAKGKVDLFLVDRETNMAGAAPTTSMVLDGSAPRASVDFPAVQATEMRVVWTPANGTDRLTVREINSFGDATLSAYAVNSGGAAPAAVADAGTGTSQDEGGSNGSDGKEVRDPKDYKDPKAMDPIAAGPTQYLPGALGFPPNINRTLANIPSPRVPGTPDTPDEPPIPEVPGTPDQPLSPLP